MKELDDFSEELIDDDELEEMPLELDDEEYYEDDDEFDEPYELRTAVMIKNEMLALLSLKITSDGNGIIVRVDPRQPLPAAQTYQDADAAAAWFNRSLATSKRNGWHIIYLGEPLVG